MSAGSRLSQSEEWAALSVPPFFVDGLYTCVRATFAAGCAAPPAADWAGWLGVPPPPPPQAESTKASAAVAAPASACFLLID
ncbi:hypothetical protein GCM10023334_063420 [Nonomuraea thailandensis]